MWVHFGVLLGRSVVSPRQQIIVETALSERQPEAQLDGSCSVGQTWARYGLPICRVCLGGVVEAIIRPVEHIEHVHEASDRPAAAELDTLLEPHVHTMNRLPDEAFTGNDRTIRSEGVIQPQAVETCCSAESTCVASAESLGAQAGAVEIDAAHLEAVRHLPDAVEGQPMPLIGFR